VTTPPTVVHEATERSELGVACRDGRLHRGPEYLRDRDPARVVAECDERAVGSSSYWCSGAPHSLVRRTVTTSAWEPADP